MNQFKFLSLVGISLRGIHRSFLLLATALIFLVFTSPVFAHHLTGGKTPSNFFEGFMSGLGHPVIGFDHFAFIVAVGLLAAFKPQGILIPIGFVLSAMIGTGLHLLSLNLPTVELVVSGSILLFGALIVIKDNPNSPKTFATMALASLAGLFHGYAYGESIFGAQMTPLLSYLLGFTVIQLLVAGAAYAIAKKSLNAANLKSAGFVICGMGLAFTTSQIVNLIFPLPK